MGCELRKYGQSWTGGKYCLHLTSLDLEIQTLHHYRQCLAIGVNDINPIHVVYEECAGTLSTFH